MRIEEIITEGSASIPANGWPLFGVLPPKTRRKDNKATQIGGPRNGSATSLTKHLIRSSAADLSKALWRVRAERRVAVTGTPIQNSPVDIFSLLRLVGHPLGFDWPASQKDYVKPIVDRNGTDEEEFCCLHELVC